jgi:hypothetical protein
MIIALSKPQWEQMARSFTLEHQSWYSTRRHNPTSLSFRYRPVIPSLLQKASSGDRPWTLCHGRDWANGSDLYKSHAKEAVHSNFWRPMPKTLRNAMSIISSTSEKTSARSGLRRTSSYLLMERLNGIGLGDLVVICQMWHLCFRTVHSFLA